MITQIMKIFQPHMQVYLQNTFVLWRKPILVSMLDTLGKTIVPKNCRMWEFWNAM